MNCTYLASGNFKCNVERFISYDFVDRVITSQGTTSESNNVIEWDGTPDESKIFNYFTGNYQGKTNYKLDDRTYLGEYIEIWFNRPVKLLGYEFNFYQGYPIMYVIGGISENGTKFSFIEKKIIDNNYKSNIFKNMLPDMNYKGIVFIIEKLNKSIINKYSKLQVPYPLGKITFLT